MTAPSRLSVGVRVTVRDPRALTRTGVVTRMRGDAAFVDCGQTRHGLWVDLDCGRAIGESMVTVWPSGSPQAHPGFCAVVSPEGQVCGAPVRITACFLHERALAVARRANPATYAVGDHPLLVLPDGVRHRVVVYRVEGGVGSVLCRAAGVDADFDVLSGVVAGGGVVVAAPSVAAA